MPRITLQSESKRFSLETLPPDGFVTIKSLSYGQTLERRQLATRLSMEQEQAGGRSKQLSDQRKEQLSKMAIDIMQRASREFEFANCIIEHNIEDPGGNALNFRNPKTIDLLPKELGEEIEGYLDEMNGEESTEDLTPFGSQSTQSSPEETES